MSFDARKNTLELHFWLLIEISPIHSEKIICS
ncbi:PapB/FocB family fimbrial expression transcriptional regulator [Escherichia coli]